MIYNNRQPVYKEKTYVKRKVKHTEVKDGVTIFVEGKALNPYEGVPCVSLKIKSRIDTGTFENHEGSPRRLEKAQGSDIMQEQIAESQREYERLKAEALAKAEAERIKAQYDDDEEIVKEEDL